MYLAVRGVFTDQQILDGINAHVTTELDSEAVADLGAIKTNILAGSNTAERLERLERFDAMNICVEMGVLTSEATYRAQLGI